MSIGDSFISEKQIEELRQSGTELPSTQQSQQRKSLGEQFAEQEKQREDEFLERYSLKRAARSSLSQIEYDHITLYEKQQRELYIKSIQPDDDIPVIQEQTVSQKHSPTQTAPPTSPPKKLVHYGDSSEED
ncbi:hypothetical protein P9112_006810 [Eukaryota sp. TZLM1-RC]